MIDAYYLEPKDRAMWFRNLLFWILILGLTLDGYGQDEVLEDSTAVAEQADRFMERVSEEKVAEVFSSFRKYSRVPEKEVDRLASQLKGQLRSFGEDYGEIIDARFIGDRYVGEDLYERSFTCVSSSIRSVST